MQAFQNFLHVMNAVKAADAIAVKEIHVLRLLNGLREPENVFLLL